jgi:hypothetical protein
MTLKMYSSFSAWKTSQFSKRLISSTPSLPDHEKAAGRRPEEENIYQNKAAP